MKTDPQYGTFDLDTGLEAAKRIAGKSAGGCMESVRTHWEEKREYYEAFGMALLIIAFLIVPPIVTGLTNTNPDSFMLQLVAVFPSLVLGIGLMGVVLSERYRKMDDEADMSPARILIFMIVSIAVAVAIYLTASVFVIAKLVGYMILQRQIQFMLVSMIGSSLCGALSGLIGYCTSVILFFIFDLITSIIPNAIYQCWNNAKETYSSEYNTVLKERLAGDTV
jgi:hypothetical protein